MTSYEFFESIPDLRKKVETIERKIERAYTSAGPRSQMYGMRQRTLRRDHLLAIDGLIDSGCMRDLDATRDMLSRSLCLATYVLYGKSGRGGVAKMIGMDEADMVCYHYCKGMSWAQVGRMFNPDSVRKE